MKNFLAVYLGSEASFGKWGTLDAETRKQRETQGVAAWKSWVEKNARSIVDVGAPLGKTKRISASGISDTKNAIAGYTVVRAESYDEAAKLFLDHPHFTIFPGEAVEVMECLPMP